MKKLVENNYNFEDLRKIIRDLKERDDKRNIIIFAIGITAVLIFLGVIITLALKKKKDNFTDDWDDWEDWEDENEEYNEDCEEECCCTDKDVDTSVKVETIK